MSYHPNNNNAFVSALGGALAGMTIGGRPITSTASADYAKGALVALAFAEEFDTLWGVGAPDSFEVPAIQLACLSYWYGRDAESINPTTFQLVCMAIIAAINEAEIQLTAQGVTPSPYPTSNIPARAYSVSGAVTLSAVAQTVASGVVTPTISGKIKVRVSGLVRNVDSNPTLHPVIVAIKDSLGNTLQTADTIECAPATAAGRSTQAVAFNVDSDHATTDAMTYPLGTAVTLSVAMTGDVSGFTQIAAGGIQLELEEAFG